MRLSDSGRTLIKGFEGLSLKAYPDAAGYSIGYGHFGAKPGDVITRAEADRFFDSDVIKFETAVSIATPNAAQSEFDAMTSLAYNIGTAGFAGSSVARLHLMGDHSGAADAFRLWNKSTRGGVRSVDPVLVARREKERAFYLGSANTPPGSFPTPPPEQSSPGWPPPIATAPSSPSSGAYASASVASLITLAIGWVIYRLAR